jgi:hypothetical protein
MINIGNLLIGMFFGFLAQVATFYQLQGPLKFEWFKNQLLANSFNGHSYFNVIHVFSKKYGYSI